MVKNGFSDRRIGMRRSNDCNKLYIPIPERKKQQKLFIIFFTDAVIVYLVNFF